MVKDKKHVYRAAVIPYVVEDQGIKMMFMKPSNPKFGGDQFQIAKGKIEDGETPLQAALREGKEELGLFSGNIEHTAAMGQYLGRTYFFIAKIQDKDLFGDPHFETGATTWMTEQEFISQGRPLHVPVIKAAIRMIKEKEKIS